MQDFCKHFQQWHECWAQCIKPQEKYFEGDRIKYQVNALILEEKYRPEIFLSHLILLSINAVKVYHLTSYAESDVPDVIATTEG
jgi:hypothetical protein